MRETDAERVLKHFGLVEHKAQFELLLLMVESESSEAHAYELALAVIGTLMLQSGLSTAAVSKALKRAKREAPTARTISVFNGDRMLVECEGGWECFRTDTLAEFTAGEFSATDQLTSLIFHIDHAVALVETFLKE